MRLGTGILGAQARPAVLESNNAAPLEELVITVGERQALAGDVRHELHLRSSSRRGALMGCGAAVILLILLY